MDSNADTEMKKKKKSKSTLINHPRKENFAFNFFYQSDIADQASW